jgi:hypothetical protein
MSQYVQLNTVSWSKSRQANSIYVKNGFHCVSVVEYDNLYDNNCMIYDNNNIIYDNSDVMYDDSLICSDNNQVLHMQDNWSAFLDRFRYFQ